MTHQNNVDPRWGEKNRDKKAQAIFYTLRQHRRAEAGETWIDIGCGSGGIAATLAPHVGRVIGIDPESWARWSGYREDFPNLEFHIGSYKDISKFLEPGSADVVICNQVYEHVDDPIALLQAIRSALKHDGICYFAGPNLLWPIEPHVFWPLVHWLPRKTAQNIMRRLGSRRADSLDAYSWSYNKLISAFKEVELTYMSAIQLRLAASLENASRKKSSRLVNLLPKSLFRWLTPIAPGFVFILSKS